MVVRTGAERQVSVSMKSAAFVPEIWILENVTEAAPRLFKTMSCAVLDWPVVVEGKVSVAGLVPSVGA